MITLRTGFESKQSWLNQQNEGLKQKYFEKIDIYVDVLGDSGGLKGKRFSNKFSKNVM